MNAREKALEIYNKMDWFTHGYVGSSMLSNTEFDDAKIRSTKAASMVVIEQMLDTLKSCWDEQGAFNMYNFWEQVKIELERL